MSSIGSDSNRSVVPRWQMSSTFASTAEAKAVRPLARNVDFESWFDQALIDWRENGEAGYLADLFSTALAERRDGVLRELAIAVVDRGDSFPKTLQGLAEKILRPPSERRSEEIFSLDVDGAREVLCRRIRILRKQVADFPRDAFGWHDLAYHYNLIGEKSKADRSMLAALRVSDSHRVIARGASRFYFHQKDSEKALSVLKRSQGFSKDPWLLSAHLAVAHMSGIEASNLGVAKRLLEELGAQIQTSELGMAVATNELFYGKLKKAKAIARDAGRYATENALAQAVWLSPRMNIDLVTEQDVAQARQGYEARCWEAFYRGNWRESMDHVLEWLRFEPYSKIPSLHGSFVASTLLQEYALSASIAQFGLAANPDDWMLRNNLVVALARDGKIEQASLEFEKLQALDDQGRDVAVWSATQGLMKYRVGEYEAARDFYESARLELVRRRDRSGQIVLALYQSLEEAAVGEFDESRKIVEQVHDSLKLRGAQGDLRNLLKSEILESSHLAKIAR